MVRKDRSVQKIDYIVKYIKMVFYGHDPISIDAI